MLTFTSCCAAMLVSGVLYICTAALLKGISDWGLPVWIAVNMYNIAELTDKVAI